MLDPPTQSFQNLLGLDLLWPGRIPDSWAEFAMGKVEISQMLTERTNWPVRIVCFKRGPNVPFRRQSCFVHWNVGAAPTPDVLNGWLPQMLQQRYGWREPLFCSYVNQVACGT